MNRMLVLTIVIALSVSGGLFSQTQKPAPPADWSGTWTGNTLVGAETNTLTLTLEKKENGYSGTISDSMGMLNQAALQNLKHDPDKGMMTFFFMVSMNSQDLRIDGTLKFEGGKMSGTWAAESGDAGSFQLERKK